VCCDGRNFSLPWLVALPWKSQLCIKLCLALLGQDTQFDGVLRSTVRGSHWDRYPQCPMHDACILVVPVLSLTQG
jgi:hypothetical protein